MSSHGSFQDSSENDGKKKSSDKKRKRRVLCHKCNQPCSGEVLKVQDRYFHIECFYCKVCKNFLSSGGFYVRGEEYYCTTDYQNLYGTKCFVCQQYVEGEVVTALNNTYHKECFKCDRCQCTFSPGSTVTYDGHKYVCQMCLDLNRPDAPPDYDNGLGPHSTTTSNNFEPRSPYGSHFVTPYETPSRKQEDKKKVKCYKCHNYINDNTLLVAMEKFWHQWCFTCSAPACKRMIAGRFVARGEEIYCETHYFERYGVRCTACNKYITGKVLMANDACYHFDCAKCAYCKRSFRHDQDLYKDSEGPRLWHQECGLTSRQEYLSRTQSEDLAMNTGTGNKTNLPDLAQLPVQREDSATPTPPTLSEDVSISLSLGLQSPPRVAHVRDYSQGSSDLSSQRSRINSHNQSVTTPTTNPNLPQFQSTPANSVLMRSFDAIVSSEQEAPSSKSTYNRRRVMSDTFHLRYSNHGSYDNFKKAHQFFTSRETSTELLFPPRTEPSPKQHIRQLSDLSSTSSGADRRTSPVSMSPQRSPSISDSSTSTIKRTLKETHSHFEETIDEREELEPLTIEPSITSDSSSCLHSVASAPQLDQPSPDNRRPRSVEGTSRKQHKTISESRTHSQINRKMRPKSEFNFKSMPEQTAVYPLQKLLVTTGEYQVFPRDVDRSRLEQHLSAEDFFLLFSMTKEEFSVLPPWKQGDMKRRAKLF